MIPRIMEANQHIGETSLYPWPGHLAEHREDVNCKIVGCKPAHSHQCAAVEVLTVKTQKQVHAHCSWCHETFPNSEVRLRKSGADICPKCKTENFTCVLDGHYQCVCGVKDENDVPEP